MERHSGYCEDVKNITVSVPEEVYRRARIKAAEKNKSVSALVRDFLVGLSDEESDFERGLRTHREVLATVQHFDGSERLTREEVHDRDALR